MSKNAVELGSVFVVLTLQRLPDIVFCDFCGRLRSLRFLLLFDADTYYIHDQ